MKTRLPRGASETPTKPSFRNFQVHYALECLLSRGFKVSDRVSREFYDILRKTGVTNDNYFLLKSGNNNNDDNEDDRGAGKVFVPIRFYRIAKYLNVQ